MKDLQSAFDESFFEEMSGIYESTMIEEEAIQ